MLTCYFIVYLCYVYLLRSLFDSLLWLALDVLHSFLVSVMYAITKTNSFLDKPLLSKLTVPFFASIECMEYVSEITTTVIETMLH